MSTKQAEIRSASFRIMSETPGHVTYGIWVNGGKCGNLVVRQEEAVSFEIMMRRGGFAAPTFAETYDENARRRGQYND